MTPRHLLTFGGAAALFLGGCQANKPAAKAPAIPAAQHQDTSKPKVDQMDASADSLEALTRKAQAYANEIAPMVEARNANRQPMKTTTAPSQVTWLDPSEFRLGAAAISTDNSAKSNSAIIPILKTTPGSANQPAQTSDAANEKRPVELAVADSVPTIAPTRAVPSAASVTDALSDKLSKRVKEYPRDVSAQLEYQLFEFLRDETTPQLATLSGLPSEDRELVTAVLDGLANFRNALRADNNMLLSRKIKPLLDMTERLRSQADLMIPTMVLCKSVQTFASYEPIEPARFPADRENQVIVYCEVANFTSNLSDKQLWETRLTWDLTLFTEAGMQIWSDKTETIVDAARVRRRDFFVRKVITLPKNLSMGRYLLKASLVDTQSNRVAEATTPIVIAAQ